MCYNNETRVEALSKVSLTELKKMRNVGKKTVEEFKELCYYANVKPLK